MIDGFYTAEEIKPLLGLKSQRGDCRTLNKYVLKGNKIFHSDFFVKFILTFLFSKEHNQNKKIIFRKTSRAHVWQVNPPANYQARGSGTGFDDFLSFQPATPAAVSDKPSIRNAYD